MTNSRTREATTAARELEVGVRRRISQLDSPLVGGVA
jgi:hypothetical protein